MAKDKTTRPGGRSLNRFQAEVAQLVSNGVSRPIAEQIVQQRAENALKQGWGMSASQTTRSEGNKTGGGGRTAANRKKK